MTGAPSALERARLAIRETWSNAPPFLRRFWPWLLVGGIAAGFLLVLLLRSGGEVAKGGDVATGGGDAPRATNAAGGAGTVAGAGEAGAGTEPLAPVHPPLSPKAAEVDAGPPLSPNVKLTLRTYPMRRATVTWGSKRLGFIDRGKPLVLERPRDSGPLDLIIRATGYLPVHTRAYTFNDGNVEVKLTPVDKMDTVYGYQQPLADAGAPLTTIP